MNEQEKRVENKQEERLAMDVFRELKADHKEERKRWFRAQIFSILFILINNMIWIYAWNLPSEESTTTSTYTIDSEDNGNAVYNNSGKVDINGKDKDSKNNKKDKKEQATTKSQR